VGEIVDRATLVDVTARVVEVVLTPVAAATNVIDDAPAVKVCDFNPQSEDKVVVPNDPTLEAGVVAFVDFSLFWKIVATSDAVNVEADVNVKPPTVTLSPERISLNVVDTSSAVPVAPVTEMLEVAARAVVQVCATLVTSPFAAALATTVDPEASPVEKSPVPNLVSASNEPKPVVECKVVASAAVVPAFKLAYNPANCEEETVALAVNFRPFKV